jgi:hypothetical protein
LVNNFVPSRGPAIDVLAYHANPLVGTLPFAEVAAGTFTLTNNVFLDLDPKRVGKPFATFRGEGPRVVGVQNLDTNAIYRPQGAAPTIVYATGSPVVSTSYSIDSAPGVTNVVLADPKLDGAMRPRAGSPLIGAAKRLGLKRRDVTGRERRAKPTIGAFEPTGV